MRPPLVIVRDEATLYHLLASSEIHPGATIVVDRRSGGDRRRACAASVERRRGERRQHDVTEALRRDGFGIVHPHGPVVEVDEALS